MRFGKVHGESRTAIQANFFREWGLSGASGGDLGLRLPAHLCCSTS